MSMTYKVNVMILRDQAERRGIRSVEELSEISGVNRDMLLPVLELSLIHIYSMQCFRGITLPMLTPSTFFVVMMLTINSFKVFDLVYLMTEGGPGNASTMMSQYIYNRAFIAWNYGESSAAAMILFLILGLLTLCLLYTSRCV